MQIKEVIESSKRHWKTALPHLSIDCVVFGFDQKRLNVLLLKLKDNANNWILPGGYVLKEEALDDAAKRILKERSGADKIFLNTFNVFGNLNRSEGYFKEYDDNLWHKQRFVTIGYYALVDHKIVTPVVDASSEDCRWMPIDELPEMVMDHKNIIENALATLREQIRYKPIGYNLLPEEFTMPELQNLYEAILGYKLNRGNFYRRIMRYNILKRLDKERKGGAHKAPILYSFDKDNYQKALSEFGW